MNLVIGSGPAGVAAARALLDRGETVTLLDVGRRLPSPYSDSLKRLRSLPPSRWLADDLEIIRGSTHSSHRGIELKTTYGSDYAYRPLNDVDHLPSSILIRASYAKGGLSNVWGGAMLPYHSRDAESWPFPLETLRPHYEKILSHLDYSAVEDNLANQFPLHSQTLKALRPSRQAQAFLSHIEKNRATLENRGFYAGNPRLAVRVEDDAHGKGCVYCGACLTGCPYELIFNSASWIDEWEGKIRFSYRPGVYVDRIQETSSGVEVRIKEESSGEISSIKADRVFLAAGFLSTARILLSSLNCYGSEFQVKASQYFIFPFLSQIPISKVREEKLHTLCQFFLEIANPEITSRFINLQGYTYNPFLGNYIEDRLGPLARILNPLVNQFLGRLLIFQGYLHSDDSPHITMKLSKTSEGDRFEFKRIENVRTKEIIKRLMRQMGRSRRELGGTVLSWMLAMGKIGDGSHLGGCFPMRKNPGSQESDLLGRPMGLRRVYVVDSSVFPSIPATTVTLSVMANAHRIASEAA